MSLHFVRFNTVQKSKVHLLTTALAVTSITILAQDTRHSIRDAKGVEACVIHVPTSVSRVPESDRVAINVRVPDTHRACPP